MKPVKSVSASKAQAVDFKKIAENALVANALAMAEAHGVQPVSSTAMLADCCIYNLAEIDRAAAIEYFNVVLDEVHAGGSSPEMERRRFAAFDRLAASAQLLAARTEGTA